MKQEWMTRPERSNVWVIRLIVWIALRLGRRAVRLLLYPISLYFYIFSARARAASRNYLGRVLGRSPAAVEGFRHCFHFAATILDRVFLLNGQSALLDIRIDGTEVFDAIRGQKQGCLLIGAHMGSFEVAHALGRDYGLPPTSMVMYEDNARKLNSVLHGINPELNPPVIPLGRFDSMLKIQEALQRGEYAGMLADRSISGGKTIRCDFLGGQVDLPLTPFRLAAVLGYPAVLMFGLYQGGNRYNIRFEKLLDPQQVEQLGRDRAIRQAAQQFAARLEHYCRESPYNWFNFYDIWVN